MIHKSKKINDPIVERLRSISQELPELKHTARIYEVILPLLRDSDLQVRHVSITAEEARAKIGRGVPLLHDLHFEVDVLAVRQLMIKIAGTIERVSRKSAQGMAWLHTWLKTDTAAGRIRTALEENKLDVALLLAGIAEDHGDQFIAAAKNLNLDPGLLRVVAQNALKPALRACCSELSPLAADIRWNKGRCFVCGAPALLGEFQDNAQVKHLRCGACGADWQFPRLECMYCGNDDHESQRYLYAEKEKEKRRVEVCDKCRGYLKVISAFSPTPPEMLAIEDIATMHLDFIARERGYSKSSVIRNGTPPGNHEDRLSPYRSQVSQLF